MVRSVARTVSGTSRRQFLSRVLLGSLSIPLLAACGGPAQTAVTSASASAATSAAAAAPTTAAATQASASAATTAAASTSAPAATTAAAASTASAASTAAASTAVAGPAAATSSSAPAATKASGTVTEMAITTEWPNQQVIQKWEQANGIKINFVNYDLVHLIAMSAAGSPPDMYRCQAPNVPYYAISLKMAKDLTTNFRLSTKLNPDDLLPANKNYWYEGTTPFEGHIYGMVKDWSPDLSLFINKDLFAQAGITLPKEDAVLTYQDLAAYAQKLTKRQGSRTLLMGYSGSALSWFDRQVEAMLNSKGSTMWPTYDELAWNTKDAQDILQYWFDLAKAGAMYSPINPEPSWAGTEMPDNQVAIVQYGYWFSGQIDTAKNTKNQLVRDNIMMLSAPTWGPKHTDPTITATGDMIHSKTKNPDATWAVFEWFHTGEPALERARSGWGVPALQSLLKYMPTSDAFQQEVARVLQGELKISDVAVKYNPYINQSEDASQNAILSAWLKNLPLALKGQMTFGDLVKGTIDATNAAIKAGKVGLA